MSERTDPNKEFGRIGEILAEKSVWADPPGHIAPALMAEINGEDVPSASVAKRPRTRPRWMWPAAAALAGAMAVLLFSIFVPLGDQGDPSGLIFALAGEGVSGSAEVGPAEAGWWIRLQMPGLDPAPEGSYYEGWVSDGTDLVSVGTFHMRDGDYVLLWSGVPMTDYPELLVTREVVADGPTPSDDVVATGRLPG